MHSVVTELKAAVLACCGSGGCKGNGLRCPLATTFAQEVAEQSGDPLLFSPQHRERLAAAVPSPPPPTTTNREGATPDAP